MTYKHYLRDIHDIHNIHDIHDIPARVHVMRMYMPLAKPANDACNHVKPIT